MTEEDTTDPVAPDPGTPEAIRDEMAQTRAALSRKLGALQELLLGTPHPARTGERVAMAKTKKAGGAARTAKKPAAKAKPAAKKTTAKKSAAGQTLTKAKAGSKKTTAARTLAKGAAAKTTARKPAAKKKASPKKKSIGSKVVRKVKEVLGDLAAGAAAGAVGGAAAAAAPHVGQAAASIDQTAEQPPAIGGPTPTM